MRATVVSYDEAAGWGVVAVADGRKLPFHCTAIADGSRVVDVGTVVMVVAAPGLHGRWEARALTAVDQPPASVPGSPSAG